MKGKRHTTEQKIRILRKADDGKSIVHQPEPTTNTPLGPVFGTRSEKNSNYFREPVIDATKRATFQPAISDGAPYEQQVVYEVSFVITRD